MTPAEAHALAGWYIPNNWRTLRTAQVNGFIGHPERGVACYIGDSAAAQLRRQGAKVRSKYDHKVKHKGKEGGNWMTENKRPRLRVL